MFVGNMRHGGEVNQALPAATSPVVFLFHEYHGQSNLICIHIY
jgi:hypothetical protein